ncbi:flavin reductase family protein [Hoeflea sp. CAU 1731]
MLEPPVRPLSDDDPTYQGLILDRFDPQSRYKLLTGTVTPRPIALVSTVSSEGIVNVAPFSQFMIVAANPGLLGFSTSPLADGPKHTVRNIKESGELVINIPTFSMAEQVQACAEELPEGVSEARHSGLDLVASETVAPPRVADAPVQFECALEKFVEFGDLPNIIVVARVRLMHLREDLLLPGNRVDTVALDPLARIGGRNYTQLGQLKEV